MRTLRFETLLIIFCFCGLKLNSQTTGKSVTEVILSGYSARTFSTKPVTDDNINLILECGLKAPSSKNTQPWRFTVVKDSAILVDLIPKITPGNILIVISGFDPKQEGRNIDFDCALAMENMYLATQSLGLGAHIYAGPVNIINSSKKQILDIPADCRVISILRIGNIDQSVDAVSSPSTRKKIEEIVNYR